MKKFISFLSAVLLSLTALLPTTAFADEVDNILSRVENYFNTGYYYEAKNELNWLYQYHGSELTYGRDKTAEYYLGQVDYAIKHMETVFAWFDKIDSYYGKGMYYEARDELNWLYDTYNLTPSQLKTWNKKKANIDAQIEQLKIAEQLANSPSYTHSVSSWFDKIDDYYSNGYYYEARDELTWLKNTYNLNSSQLSTWNQKRDNVNYAIKYMDKVFAWFGKVESYYNRKLYYEARDELTWLKDTYKLTPSQLATWNKWKTAVNNRINAYEAKLAEDRARAEANKVYYTTWSSNVCSFKVRSSWSSYKIDYGVQCEKNSNYYRYNVYTAKMPGDTEGSLHYSLRFSFSYSTIISEGYETVNGYTGYQITYKNDHHLAKAWAYAHRGELHIFYMYTPQSSWPDELYKAFYETLGSVNFY